MRDIDIPQPNRNWLIGYTCPVILEDLHGCNEHFVLRSSYERHWIHQHRFKAVPVLTEVRLGGTPLLHYLAAEHQTGPDCQCGPTWVTIVDPGLPTITTKDGHAVPDEGDEPDLVAWNEVDRKEAAARLDAYLEPKATATASWYSDITSAHHVEVTPCPCGFVGCPIKYHECTVCGIVTMVPPPLPCPGPRKDT